MRIQFNTGRPYTKEGQIIIAETFNGGIAFNDISRGVDEFIPKEFLEGFDYSTESELQDMVMYCYDYGCSYPAKASSEEKVFTFDNCHEGSNYAWGLK